MNNAREMQKQAAKSAKDAGKNKGMSVLLGGTKRLPSDNTALTGVKGGTRNTNGVRGEAASDTRTL